MLAQCRPGWYDNWDSWWYLRVTSPCRQDSAEPLVGWPFARTVVAADYRDSVCCIEAVVGGIDHRVVSSLFALLRHFDQYFELRGCHIRHRNSRRDCSAAHNWYKKRSWGALRALLKPACSGRNLCRKPCLLEPRCGRRCRCALLVEMA